MKLNPIREVVDNLGGPHRVAELTQVQVDTVYAWPRLGTLPANTYLVLTTELRRLHRNIPPPSLWGMKEHPELRA